MIELTIINYGQVIDYLRSLVREPLMNSGRVGYSLDVMYVLMGPTSGSHFIPLLSQEGYVLLHNYL